MKKEFGAFLILGLLVLSLSFTSAGWFYDGWNKITGKAISSTSAWSYQEKPDSIDVSKRYFIYVNYTKPLGATAKSLWLVKHGSYAPYNISLPAACWNADPKKLILYLVSNTNNGDSTSASGAACFNGTAWVGVSKIASEKYYWGRNYPCVNSSIALDGNWDNFVVMNQYQNTNDSKNCWTNSTLLGNSVKIYEEAMYWNMEVSAPICASFNYSDWSSCSNSVQTRTVVTSSPSGCTGGSPVLSQNCVMPFCIDSDGGLDYYVKGDLNQTFNQIPHSDYCVNSSVLNEWSCISNGTFRFDEYVCPYGCSDGACWITPPRVSTCNETSKTCLLYASKNMSLPAQKVNPLNNSVYVVSLDATSVILNVEGIKSLAMGVGDAFEIPGFKLKINDILYNSKESGYSAVEFSYASVVPVEPNASCAENYKIRTINFNDAEGVDRVTLQKLVGGYWQDVCINKEVGDVCYIGNIEIKLVFINISSVTAYLTVNSPSIIDYKSIDEPSLSYVFINSTGVEFNSILDNYFVVSYCTNTSVQVCQAEVNKVKNPSNMVIEGVKYSLNYNNSYVDRYSGETYSYASWFGEEDYGYNYVWANVAEMKDSSVVQQRLNESLESGICQVSRVSMNYTTNEYQNVYLCKNIWRIAQQNQHISTGDAWNYQNDAVALWFNNNLLFSFEFSSNNYNNCNDPESCDRIQEENHRRQQSDLIAAMDKLINNKVEYTDAGYLSYRAEQFVKQFLFGCVSQVKDVEYLGAWYCRMDPIVCPPHGEQKQICTRSNQVTKKDETRETTTQCNPGVCSGCMVPKWFGSTWESKCIPYGFRFEHQIGFGTQVMEESDRDVLTVEEANRDGEIVLSVYNDSHATLLVPEWGNITYSFKKGDTVNIDVSGWNDGYLALSMYINDVVFKPANSSLSYIDVTFAAKREGRTVTSLNAYCEINGQVSQQKISNPDGSWANCQNNYECFSNVCSSGACVDTDALAAEIKGFKGFIIRMLCRLSNPFSDQGYTQCLVDNQ